MTDLNKIERMFNQHLNKIKNCTNIKELIEVSKVKSNTGDLVPMYSMKFFNKKFKGNFDKAKQYVIKEAHLDYNNAIESYCEEF